MNTEIGLKRRGWLFKIIAILCPVASILIVMPFIVEMPPLAFPPNANILQVLMVLPWYLGLTAAPGYLYVLLFEPDGNSMSIARRKWVHVSLVCAIVASVGGLSAILFVLPTPFLVGSLVCSVLVQRDFNSPQI